MLLRCSPLSFLLITRLSTFSVGAGTVVHPTAVIKAEAGPIVIGGCNIIEEQTQILHLSSVTASADPTSANVMTIGSHNMFEVGSRVISSNVGNGNTFHARAVLQRGSVVGDGCVIGLRVELPAGTKLGDSTVLYGVTGERPAGGAEGEHGALHSRHLQTLWSTLPQFYATSQKT